MPDATALTESSKNAPEASCFPFFAGARYDYEMRFEGNISHVWWTAREIKLSDGPAFCFPVENGDFVDNDYWGGHAFRAEAGKLWMADAPEAPFQLIAEVAAAQGTTWAPLPETTHSGRVYRHLGFEDVATPATRYPACFKLQMDDTLALPADSPATEAAISTAYLYFARGIGLVKVGFPDGEIVLKAFHREANTAPPPPKRPTEETAIGANPHGPVASQAAATPRKKRWWKFW